MNKALETSIACRTLFGRIACSVGALFSVIIISDFRPDPLTATGAILFFIASYFLYYASAYILFLIFPHKTNMQAKISSFLFIALMLCASILYAVFR